MTISPEVAQRLAHVRLLLAEAVESCARPEPYAYDGLNRLHDVAEMFLALAAQQHSLGIPKELEQYWNLLADVLGRPLGYRVQLQRMSKARVAYKHYGTQPARIEVDAAASAVAALLTDECEPLFGVALDQVSVTRLIACQPARELVLSAEEGWASGDHGVALADLAEAFDVLIKDYEGRKRIGYRRSVFDSTPDMTFLSGFHRGLSRKDSEFADKVIEALTALDFTIMIVGLGVDLRRYGRFKAITPSLVYALGGARHLYQATTASPAQADFDFCRDFIVQTAIHLAEFDYDLEDPILARRPAVGDPRNETD